MTNLFEDLKRGLDEVEAFLGGETGGYRVHPAARPEDEAGQDENTELEF